MYRFSITNSNSEAAQWLTNSKVKWTWKGSRGHYFLAFTVKLLETIMSPGKSFPFLPRTERTDLKTNKSQRDAQCMISVHVSLMIINYKLNGHFLSFHLYVYLYTCFHVFTCVCLCVGAARGQQQDPFHLSTFLFNTVFLTEAGWSSPVG